MDLEYSLEWLRFADRNLGIAEHLDATYHPRPLEDICFNCHQSAEKYLKGYLIYHSSAMPPRTHDLINLCSLCATYDSRFDNLAKVCSTLNPYAIQPKYPREIYIDEALTKKAILHANEIKSFAPIMELRSQLEEEPHVPGP